MKDLKKEYYSFQLTEAIKCYIENVLTSKDWIIEAIDTNANRVVIKRYIEEK